MKKLILPFLISFPLLMTSCDEVSDMIGDGALTEAEVVSGLKSALSVGTDSAVSFLAVENGYYGNELYKIFLPEEANVIIDNISKIPGGQGLVDDVIKGINRAAEDAAKDAGPIFVTAITDMTITEGWDILNGDTHAATTYLQSKTNSGLFNLYNPKIETSLDKDLGLGFSANSAWNTLTSNWNTVANSIVGQIAGYEPVNTDLDSYLTQKALDGMYLKISKEEEQIRLDPMARVNEILQKVFGSVD